MTTGLSSAGGGGSIETARKPRSGSRIYVTRLAACVRVLDERRDRRELLAAKLAQLRGANLVTVVGEEGLLDALDARLKEACDVLDMLREDATPVGDALDGMHQALEGYEWDVVDAVMPQLARKVDEQNKLILQLQADVDQWATRLEPVRSAIQEALAIRAPVARERTTVDRMDGLVTAAERALADGRYNDVSDPLRRLTEAEPPEDVLERVGEKMTATKRFRGRAEVLLLRSIVDDLHSYTVLLRTPSEVGTQGFNIQDSSMLVDQDRHYLRQAIEQITSAVDLGIARAFRRAEEPGQASSQPAGAVRDLRPGPPPQAQSLSTTTTAEDLPTLIADVGKVMFRLIAPDRMRQYISGNPCALTITTDDLELPWELMYDESLADPATDADLGFLCLQRPIARMPMGRAFPRLRPMTRQKARLRFLLIYADPDQNLTAAEHEIDMIKNALESGLGTSDDIEVDTLRREEITGEKLNKALLTGRYDVIHFAGHAYFSEENPDLSGLVLHDGERFLSQKIERFVEGQPLVFLNACQTGRTANADAPQAVGTYFWEPAQGLASAFLYGGALGCVGSLWPVYDEPAAEFAIEFYRQVLEGQMLGEAMRLARRTTREKHQESITWASFVLYGDPTYRLVR